MHKLTVSLKRSTRVFALCDPKWRFDTMQRDGGTPNHRKPANIAPNSAPNPTRRTDDTLQRQDRPLCRVSGFRLQRNALHRPINNNRQFEDGFGG